MDNEALEAIYGNMTEAALEAEVRRAALLAGWLYYHTHDSRRSDEGWPDCFMVRRGRIKVRELKSQKGKPTEAQLTWLEKLKGAGLDVGIWRPFDWGNGTILKELE